MLVWGFNFVAVKLALVQMSTSSLTLVRYVIMYLALLAVCRVQGVHLRYPKEDALKILGVGFLTMGIYMVFFIQGMKGSTAPEGAIIMATSPAFTLGMAVLLRQERLRWQGPAGIAVAFGGVAIVVAFGAGAPLQPQPDHLLGNGLIFAAAILWALGTVLTRPLVAKYDPMRVLTLSMPGALPVLLPFGLLSSLHQSYEAYTGITWSMLFYAAVLSGVVGFALFYLGVRQIGASRAMTYQYLVTPLAAVFGWLCLGTGLRPAQFFGLVLVLAGVAIASAKHRATSAETYPGELEVQGA